ncbi:exoribonuclease II [Enterobacteriaceae endosymbiont of Donacia tomentosa]|uniref:exoribonuclease II n=1 Tax=Enterobacteriaceae endosymbiont of Donacia tomentosa TaxID=2675787 RepID=UPI0014499F23|nr:exoribonuclease II [Enterobacteriaceae endosymbiont of Donacia tomentosa]QJC31483.1 exoribonuclease II [Enterobacteriaceae endosymbiont of Donacia tomentosa]
MLYNNISLLKLKKQLTNTLPHIKGIIKIISQKIGILETDKNYIYTIPYIYLKNIMEGDYVLAKIEHNNEKLYAIPIKLLKSNINIFIGIIKKKNKNFFIIPEKKILLNNLIKCYIKKNVTHTLNDKDKVMAKIVHHPLRGDDIFLAEVIEYINQDNNYLLPWWSILSKYNLNTNPPDDWLCQKISFLDKNFFRKDLTHLCFITIDNNETKDIDDALYIEKISSKKLLVYVAISDPTAYIKQDSTIDKIASERMFTNYLPGLTIPLLPKLLSEDLCSLNPNKIRPVLICKMIINSEGFLLEKNKFLMGWIKSKAKLSYNNVSDWLEKKTSTWHPKNNDIENQIILLYKFYLYRKKWSNNHIVFFQNPDYKFIFGDKGKILNIIIEKKRIAHKMIEEIMITANICATEFLYKKSHFAIYNIYYGFDYNKINKVVLLLDQYGIKCDAAFLMTLKGYKTIFNKLNDLDLSFVINRIKKYQHITMFSTKPGPHFGLGLKRYATWTSPIRKFGDIINHRLIKSILNKDNIKKPLDNIYIIMNQQRRLNKQAEKDLLNFLYSIYFKKIFIRGQVFLSEIIDILSNGIKVRLIKSGALAFIPKHFLYQNLNDILIKPNKGMIFIKNKLLYKVTDQIQVIIKEINIHNNIIVKIV